MHPFGGTPNCPRCSKAVYAAEQVSFVVPLTSSIRAHIYETHYRSWAPAGKCVFSFPLILAYDADPNSLAQLYHKVCYH
jgi:hypothetical protein